jgi:hypothetical protein
MKRNAVGLVLVLVIAVLFELFDLGYYTKSIILALMLLAFISLLLAFQMIFRSRKFRISDILLIAPSVLLLVLVAAEIRGVVPRAVTWVVFIAATVLCLGLFLRDSESSGLTK